MHFSKIFKVREGKLEKWKGWMRELDTTRRKEALETFEFENITRETFVLFKGINGEHYVLGLNETKDPSQILGPSDKNIPINFEHTAIKKECLEPISEPGEIFLDLNKM